MFASGDAPTVQVSEVTAKQPGINRDPTEVSEMKALIERMNFDHKFAIEYL